MIDAALLCMAMTIAQEAEGEPLSGQIAVGYVVYKRANYDRKQICSEVYKPYQFEWTKKPRQIDNDKFQQFLNLAQKILHKQIKDTSYGSTHFHNSALPNQWGMPIKVVINNHIFY